MKGYSIYFTFCKKNGSQPFVKAASYTCYTVDHDLGVFYLRLIMFVFNSGSVRLTWTIVTVSESWKCLVKVTTIQRIPTFYVARVG